MTRDGGSRLRLDFGYGLLLAAGGVGLVAGSLSGGGLTERLGLRALYAAASPSWRSVSGQRLSRPKSGWPRARSPWEPPGTGPPPSATRCSSEGGAPDRFRGRAFAVIMSVTFGVLGLGMVAAGVLTNTAGAPAVGDGGAGFFLLAAAVAYALMADAEAAVAAEPVPAED